MLFPLLVVSLGALQTLGTSSLVYARSNTERAEINPKTAIEAAVRTIVESPTSRCADTCEFVKGLDSISGVVQSCEKAYPLFDILVTDCLCDNILYKLSECARCEVNNSTKLAAYNSFSDICYDYGFTSRNGTAATDSPSFAHPLVVVASPLSLTQCEHATYVWATPYFTTSSFDITLMPYNPLNTSLPVELQGVGANQVTNFTWLVDYPFGTQITLNASMENAWATSSTLTIQNSSDTTCIPLGHTLTGYNSTSKLGISSSTKAPGLVWTALGLLLGLATLA